MTVSILTSLAILPSGAIGDPLSLAELGRYLGQQCNTLAEQQRNARHCLRDEIFRDGGTEFMRGAIDKFFDDIDVRNKRKAMVEYTRYDNPLKRVVNELATIYAEPAKRFVEGDENNRKYLAVLEAIGMDERMFHISCLLNLHRAMLARFRVRELPDGTREPVLDWATPANARAVLHPNDNTLVVGWLIRASFRTVREQINKPAWTLWTDHERVHLRDDFGVIEDSYLEHKLGRNPWVAVTLSPPGAGFWPGDEGEDLVSAAVCTWLASVLLVKETKSATKQTIIQGDGTNMARGQGADSENPLELAEGQSATTVDMSMDLSLFRDTADHIIEHVAQNYGMSGALIKQQGVQSADARELMRAPLHELRKRQQTPLRRFERGLVQVMEAVLRVDLPEMGFSAGGWGMTFGESHTPLSRTEEIALFEKERGACVDNTIAFIQRRLNCTWEQAVEVMEENILAEQRRNEMMRPLSAISGATSKPQPASPTDGQPAHGVNNVQEPSPLARGEASG